MIAQAARVQMDASSAEQSSCSNTRGSAGVCCYFDAICVRGDGGGWRGGGLGFGQWVDQTMAPVNADRRVTKDVDIRSVLLKFCNH